MTLKFGEPDYVLMPRQKRPMKGTDQTTMERKQEQEEEDSHRLNNIHKEKAAELAVQMSEVHNCSGIEQCDAKKKNRKVPVFSQ